MQRVDIYEKIDSTILTIGSTPMEAFDQRKNRV